MESVDVSVAESDDLRDILRFLSLPTIDSLFKRPLSDREVSLSERVFGIDPPRFWYIARAHQSLIGCRCAKLISPGIVQFSTFVVHPDYHQRGVGSALFEFAIDHALKTWSPTELRTDSWVGNNAMARLAARHGFEKVRVYSDPEKRPPGIESVEYVRLVKTE